MTPAGAVYACGSNAVGQLGQDLQAAVNSSSEAAPVSTAALPEAVTQVVAGTFHSGALAASGSVYMWGSNSQVGRQGGREAGRGAHGGLGSAWGTRWWRGARLVAPHPNMDPPSLFLLLRRRAS